MAARKRGPSRAARRYWSDRQGPGRARARWLCRGLPARPGGRSSKSAPVRLVTMSKAMLAVQPAPRGRAGMDQRSAMLGAIGGAGGERRIARAIQRPAPQRKRYGLLAEQLETLGGSSRRAHERRYLLQRARQPLATQPGQPILRRSAPADEGCGLAGERQAPLLLRSVVDLGRLGAPCSPSRGFEQIEHRPAMLLHGSTRHANLDLQPLRGDPRRAAGFVRSLGGLSGSRAAEGLGEPTGHLRAHGGHRAAGESELTLRRLVGGQHLSAQGVQPVGQLLRTEGQHRLDDPGAPQRLNVGGSGIRAG